MQIYNPLQAPVQVTEGGSTPANLGNVLSVVVGNSTAVKLIDANATRVSVRIYAGDTALTLGGDNSMTAATLAAIPAGGFADLSNTGEIWGLRGSGSSPAEVQEETE